jgi:hypothetical protein
MELYEDREKGAFAQIVRESCSYQSTPIRRLDLSPNSRRFRTMVVERVRFLGHWSAIASRTLVASSIRTRKVLASLLFLFPFTLAREWAFGGWGKTVVGLIP